MADLEARAAAIFTVRRTWGADDLRNVRAWAARERLEASCRRQGSTHSTASAAGRASTLIRPAQCRSLPLHSGGASQQPHSRARIGPAPHPPQRAPRPPSRSPAACQSPSRSETMSGKRPTDHLEPVAKRRSDRQLTKDDASDDEGGEVRGRGAGAADRFMFHHSRPARASAALHRLQSLPLALGWALGAPPCACLCRLHRRCRRGDGSTARRLSLLVRPRI